MDELIEIIVKGQRGGVYMFVVHLQDGERDEIWKVTLDTILGIGETVRLQ